MRTIFIIIATLLINLNIMGQLPDFEKESLLLADTLGVKYYLIHLSVWQGEYPKMKQLFGEQTPKGKIKEMFKYTLSSEYVFSSMDDGMPLYHATMTEHYGCIVKMGKEVMIYTGDVGREFCWEDDPPDYREVLEELSPKGELQKYLGTKRILEYLNGIEKK